MLLCTVRDCRSPLQREERRLLCEQGHSFDIARSGYVNLLQPQDRRSRRPGDSAEAVRARRRLHGLGVTAPLLHAVGELMGASSDGIVLDAGCGDGFYLGSLATAAEFTAYGVDISTPAVDAAARRYPHCQWLVANADRFLPFADASFTHLISVTARMNVAEFRRVLRSDGRLLVAVPAPGDLAELRGPGKDRVPRTLETFQPAFRLLNQSRVTAGAALDAAAVEDLLLSIYRPMKREPARAMDVTFSLDLLLFEAIPEPDSTP